MNDSAKESAILLKYGQFRSISYLITSFMEFKEIIATVTQMVGRVPSQEDAVCLQQHIRFNATPLPNSLSKFLACFDVPTSLLGENGVGMPTLIDFSAMPLEKDMFQTETSAGDFELRYRGDTLFELNLALSYLDRAIKLAIRGMGAVRIRRSIVAKVIPRASKEESNQLVLSILRMSAATTRELEKGLIEAAFFPTSAKGNARTRVT